MMNRTRRGRDENGKKRRWSRARKAAARWAREAKVHISAKKSKLQPSSVQGSLIEKMPGELKDEVLSHLGARDKLRLAVSSKGHLRMLGGKEGLEMLQEMIIAENEAIEQERLRQEEEKAEKEALEYEDRMQEAVNFFNEYNVRRRTHGVSYSSVAKKFKVLTGELRERVEESWCDSEDDYDWDY